MSIELKVQFTRFMWSCGLFNLHKPVSITSQLLTSSFSIIPKYNSVQEITDSISKIKWTADPFNGKLDIVKHPTYIQEAIDQHNDLSGDCDDFAVYWIAALLKSGIVKSPKDLFMGIALWASKDKKTLTGHAVCVYKINDQWFWVSNWNRSIPFSIQNQNDWIVPVLGKNRKIIAGKYLVDGIKDVGEARDTIIFGNAVRIS